MELIKWLIGLLTMAGSMICPSQNAPVQTTPPPVFETLAPEPQYSSLNTLDIAIPETEPPELPEERPTEEELFWTKRYQECPIATEIWMQMKSYGWSDAACAGILGNIMRECGGNTIKHISPNLFNQYNSHYGLCQWAEEYYPEIQPTDDWTPSVAEQIAFLRLTILTQHDTYYNYGFTEQYLCEVTDYRAAAKIFCDGYERPGEDSACREDNAEKAWRYFVLREDM